VFHVWKVRALKRRRVNYWWRYWRSWRGEPVGNYQQLPDLIRRWAPGRSFADVGCMWGVNGEHAFIAEAAGATVVKAIDVFGPTPEFDAHHRARNSRVEFILGDITAPSTIARVGAVDVVLCAGVLYHHPSPFDVLVALRRICRQTLILRTSTIPEVHGLPNAAVFFSDAGRPRPPVMGSAKPGRRASNGHYESLQARRRLRELVLGAHAELPGVSGCLCRFSNRASGDGTLCPDRYR
jgi:SAM-dependent methyltransferase